MSFDLFWACPNKSSLRPIRWIPSLPSYKGLGALGLDSFSWIEILYSFSSPLALRGWPPWRRLGRSSSYPLIKGRGVLELSLATLRRLGCPWTVKGYQVLVHLFGVRFFVDRGVARWIGVPYVLQVACSSRDWEDSYPVVLAVKDRATIYGSAEEIRIIVPLWKV